MACRAAPASALSCWLKLRCCLNKYQAKQTEPERATSCARAVAFSDTLLFFYAETLVSITSCKNQDTYKNGSDAIYTAYGLFCGGDRSQLTSNCYNWGSFPCNRPFSEERFNLRVSCSPQFVAQRLTQTTSVATEAYNTAVKTLSSTLSTSELADVQATKSIEELHAVAEQVQISFSHSKRKGRLQSLVEILDHYSPVLDVLSQSHSEYTALLWGSMKWLLQVTMNYFRLLKRLATMLDEIGHSLPRFMLYERILPTDHMS